MTTYLTHFGLNKAPFAAHVAGNSVFVAPQVAAIMAGLKKALATDDAVVCLSGPVGAGKSTIARRALDGIGQKRGVVTIGRMPFGHDEILEILLAGLGARQMPKSTVHRFALFRRLLQQFAEEKTRVFILVEDATRIGLDALSELEALTDADAGVSNGANIILLGNDSLGDLLRDPKLARLKQRVRSRQKLEAQSSNELQGYLKHCFRLAGREFDTLFADGCSKTLHGLTDGLPRVVNNVLDAVLVVAAEQGLDRITPELIERVAADEFGLTGEHKAEDIAVAIEKAAAAEEVLPPLLTVTAEAIATPDEDDAIPELIQDTLPDLEILAPELAAAACEEAPILEPIAKPKPKPAAVAAPKPEPTPEPEPILQAAPEAVVHEPTENELPVLSNIVPAEARDEDGQVPNELPAWDRDPTLAELRPDLEALERAMSAAQGVEPEESIEAEVLAARKPAPVVRAAPEIVPEITLDKQIEAKIHEATEALKKSKPDEAEATRSGTDASNDDASEEAEAAKVAAVAAPAPEPKPAATRQDERRLEKIASSLAKAKTIEDVDDFMAETLFGEEFSMLAAQVAANATLHFESEADTVAATGGDSVSVVTLSLEDEEPKPSKPATLDSSPSQRLKVLRELNHSTQPRGAPSTPDPDECIVMSAGGLDAPPADDSVAVDSIEDQITTSMTQTLRALSIRPDAKSDAADASDEDDDDDDEDGTSKGFFSRFRRK